jgi:hypothetical protein
VPREVVREPGAEVVEDANRRAAIDERVNEVRADEACPAGHKAGRAAKRSGRKVKRGNGHNALVPWGKGSGEL